MYKNIFHNYKISDDVFIENIVSKKLKLKKEKKVDINHLLNRVKLQQRNEIKEKIIYLALGFFILTLTGFYLYIIK